MNNWKEHFIAYIKSLDENITIDDAEPLIYDELTRIKEVCSEETLKLNMPDDFMGIGRNALVMGVYPLLEDVNDREIEEEDKTLSWEKKKEEKIPEDLPNYIDVVLYDKIYVPQAKLHSFLKKKLIGMTVFHNPEYYLMLPIGLETTLREICESYHVRVESVDKRFAGQPIDVMFYGDLREKQIKAVEEMLGYIVFNIANLMERTGKTVCRTSPQRIPREEGSSYL